MTAAAVRVATHFIADVHITGDADPNAARLIGYLAGFARGADALYILGDLFDVWIGDDGSLAAHAAILDAFAALTDAGVPAWFMRGNRDFAVGGEFAARSGLRVIEDPWVVELYGIPTLLCHGDALCTDDRSHQVFRARYTDPRWRARMHRLPLALRRALARRARRRSRPDKARKPADSLDVNAQAVSHTMAAHDVTRIIHGHTHRPATHPVDCGGVAGERVVLADWRENRAEVLVVDAHGASRRSLID